MTTSEWIEWTWTEEKPYPETLETIVHVLFADGWSTEKDGSIAKVGFWVYGVNNFCKYLHDVDRITHYRLA